LGNLSNSEPDRTTKNRLHTRNKLNPEETPLTDALQEAQAQVNHYRKALYNATRRATRAIKAKELSQKKYRDLEGRVRNEKREAEKLLAAARAEAALSARGLSIARSSIKRLELKALLLRKQIRECRQYASHLQARLQRVPRARERAIQNALEKARTIHLRRDGVYTEDARDLMRTLRSCGCSAVVVGIIIRDIARTFGLEMHDIPSARTVERVVLEGGLAAQAQLIHEVKNGEGIGYTNHTEKLWH
jgi:hypothetical protein